MKTFWQSNTFRHLTYSVAIAVCLWLLAAFQTRTWDFYALGLAVVPQVLMALKRLSDPDIQAPAALDKLSGGLLNKNNDPLGKG